MLPRGRKKTNWKTLPSSDQNLAYVIYVVDVGNDIMYTLYIPYAIMTEESAITRIPNQPLVECRCSAGM